MRWVILLLGLAGLIDSLALRGLPFGALHPELTLVIVVGWALLRGWEEGLLAGLIGGLVIDVASAAPFGVNALRLASVGLAAGLLMARLAPGSSLFPFFAAAGGSLLGFVLGVLALQASGWTVGWERSLVVDALPSALLATLVMAIVFPVLQAIERRGAVADEGAEI